MSERRQKSFTVATLVNGCEVARTETPFAGGHGEKVARISVAVFDGSDARREFRRACERLRIQASELDGQSFDYLIHEEDEKPHQWFRVYGAELALDALLCIEANGRRCIVAWTALEASVPFHGSGEGAEKIKASGKTPKHRPSRICPGEVERWKEIRDETRSPLP